MTMTNTRPPRAFPSLIGFLGVWMIFGGLQLVFLGGSSYYLLAGLVLVASAMKLWKGDPMGSMVYGGLLVATVAWAFSESGTNLWALAPRILPLAIIGIWFLTPFLRNSLYNGKPPPLFKSTVSRGVTVFVVALTAGIFIAGNGWVVTSLPERSGINTVNAGTDWPSYGNTLGGSRYSPIDQINRENVQDLEVAWTYRTGIGGAFKATPLQVGELLYVCAGGNVIIALDAENGELVWQFDPLVDPGHLDLEFVR